MAQLLKNNAYSTLGATLTNVATSLTVATGTGDRFPAVTAPDFALLTLQDASNNIEIIKVTARASGSDSMTIQRAQEGTTARAWSIGDVLELRLTASVLNPLGVLEGAATAAAIRSAIGAVSKAGDTMTGPLAQAAGTAALPSYTFSGDTNTGVWSPGADILAWSTAGAERLRIDSSGNVGFAVTPSAWGSAWTALQFSKNPGISGNNVTLAGNAYHDGTNWRYTATNFASRYESNYNGAGEHLWSTAASGTAGNTITFVDRLKLDNSGNVLVTGSGGLGYGTGSGGTVTQATSKVTTVTLNKPCGLITMNNAALGAGATAVFVCNNSLVSVNELVIAEISGGGDPLNYRLRALAGGGIITFALTNITGGSLSDALGVQFSVIKGATS